MTFGDRLLEARHLRQLTQETLAKRAHINHTMLSQFESDERLPSYTHLRQLATALEVSVDYLMGRTDTPGLHGAADPLLHELVRLSARNRELARAFVRLLTTMEREGVLAVDA